jgi:hypothetical protein
VDYVAPLSFTGVHPGGNNFSAHPFDNDNLNNSFRVNNAVKFASTSYEGLRFGALYGFSNEAGGFDDNRLYSFGAAYDAGPLSLGAGYLQANNGGSSNNNTNGALTLTDRTFIAAQRGLMVRVLTIPSARRGSVSCGRTRNWADSTRSTGRTALASRRTVRARASITMK